MRHLLVGVPGVATLAFPSIRPLGESLVGRVCECNPRTASLGVDVL